MDNTEAIKELKEIIEDRKSYLVGDYDKSFERHIQALEYAIKELERTALEVPVQKQFLNKISKGSKTLLLETLLGNDVTIFVKEDREFFEVDFVDSNNRVRLLTMNLEKLSKCRYCLLSYQSS